DVSSSSLVDCSSSLAETISSLLDLSSSIAVSYSSASTAAAPALPQLALELLEMAVARLSLAVFGRRLLGSRRRAQIAEHDEVQQFVVVLAQRLYRDPDELAFMVRFQLDVVADRGPARFDRLMQRGAQRQAQALARHRHQRPARPPGGSLQIFSRPSGIVDDVALARDHDMGRRIVLEHARFDRLAQRASCRLLGLSRVAARNTVPAKQH